MRTIALLFLTTLACFGQGFSDASAPFLLSTSPLRRGLVGYWSLEESSGTRYDRTKTGNHLTAVNSPTNAVGKVSLAAKFVSASSQVCQGSTNLLTFTGTNAFTIAAWVKLTTEAGQSVCGKLDKIGASGDFGYYLGLDSSGFVYNVLASNSQYTYIRSTSTIPTNVWYQLLTTYDGSLSTNGMSIYVNGVKEAVSLSVNAASPTNLLNSSSFCIGDRSSNAALHQYFNGFIDEVSIHNRVLPTNEITLLYGGGYGRRFGFMNKP